MKIKLSIWERAERAGRIFQLHTYMGNGQQIDIPYGLRGYIQGLIALAWKRGYDAGRRSK